MIRGNRFQQYSDGIHPASGSPCSGSGSRRRGCRPTWRTPAFDGDLTEPDAQAIVCMKPPAPAYSLRFLFQRTSARGSSHQVHRTSQAHRSSRVHGASDREVGLVALVQRHVDQLPLVCEHGIRTQGQVKSRELRSPSAPSVQRDARGVYF